MTACQDWNFEIPMISRMTVWMRMRVPKTSGPRARAAMAREPRLHNPAIDFPLSRIPAFLKINWSGPVVNQ